MTPLEFWKKNLYSFWEVVNLSLSARVSISFRYSGLYVLLCFRIHFSVRKMNELLRIEYSLQPIENSKSSLLIPYNTYITLALTSAFCPYSVYVLRPPLWPSSHSSWIQIRRSGFDSQLNQTFWEAVGLERGPLSLVSTTDLVAPSIRKNWH
jgi:hypothetical protein